MVKPMDQVRAAYYIRFTVLDRPGVLSAISGVMGRRGISLAQVIQRALTPQSDWVTLVALTHAAAEGDLKAALAETGALDAVREAKLIRIEEFGFE
jgi:homoserine dehydrogenase